MHLSTEEKQAIFEKYGRVRTTQAAPKARSHFSQFVSSTSLSTSRRITRTTPQPAHLRLS